MLEHFESAIDSTVELIEDLGTRVIIDAEKIIRVKKIPEKSQIFFCIFKICASFIGACSY